MFMPFFGEFLWRKSCYTYGGPRLYYKIPELIATWIFYRENAVLSMELQDFLQVSCVDFYIECEEHVYAYFSLRKMLFSGFHWTYKKIHGIV